MTSIIWKRIFCASILSAVFLFSFLSEEILEAPKNYVKGGISRDLVAKELAEKARKKGQAEATRIGPFRFYSYDEFDEANRVGATGSGVELDAKATLPRELQLVLDWIWYGFRLPVTATKSLLTLKPSSEDVLSVEIVISWILLGAGFAAWMTFDSRRRYAARSPATFWALAGFACPVIAIPFYVQFRPEGELWPCSGCSSKYLLSLNKCPSCQKEQI